MTKSRLIYRSGPKRSYSYKYADGGTVATRDIPEHVAHMPIPPAWKEVAIARSPAAKIWATGIDKAGRTQYLYNPKFRADQDEEKFQRIIRFGQALPRMRETTRVHMNHKVLDREKVLACMVRLIDQAYFRVGNERYVEENNTYGLTTMRMRHVEVEDGQLVFHFVGKSHQEHDTEVDDASLAKVVEELTELPGSHVFSYFNDQDELVDVDSQEVNDYIKEVMGSQFSAKDFRTWAGTLIAATCLSESNIPRFLKDREVAIRGAIERVAAALGNTPAVAKKAYIDPRILNMYRKGESLTPTIERLRRGGFSKKKTELSIEEAALIRALKRL